MQYELNTQLNHAHMFVLQPWLMLRPSGLSSIVMFLGEFPSFCQACILCSLLYVNRSRTIGQVARVCIHTNRYAYVMILNVLRITSSILYLLRWHVDSGLQEKHVKFPWNLPYSLP